jgi:hypothetical protein
MRLGIPVLVTIVVIVLLVYCFVASVETRQLCFTVGWHGSLGVGKLVLSYALSFIATGAEAAAEVVLSGEMVVEVVEEVVSAIFSDFYISLSPT